MALFFSIFLKARGKFRIRIIECGWPDSRWKSRFLIIGTVNLDENQILTKVDNKLFKLDESPQRQLFKLLDQGKNLNESYYYKVAKRVLNDEDFDFWLRTKTHLWEGFNVDEEAFTPVGILTLNRCLIVEDGAHRLALRSLRGLRSHRVAISIWSFT
jgi:hypothetical protein